MALIGTIQFSELITWKCWIKKEIVKDIPSTNNINSSYEKLKKQLMNMSETIKRYIVGTVINYGENGDDNSYYLEMSIDMGNDIQIDRILVTNDRNVLLSIEGSFFYNTLHEFDIDGQIKIMNEVENKVSSMKKKDVVNFKF